MALVPVRFEQITAAVGEDHGAIVCAEWRGLYQAFAFEVPQAFAGVAAAVAEIALRDNAKGADGGEHSALGAVDLVHAIALPRWPALTAAWQVQVPREHIARLAIGHVIAFAAPAAASVAEVVVIAVI